MSPGFAIADAPGGVCERGCPADIRRASGLSVSAALLVHLARGWQARPKLVKIAG
jgi:hypothetical protein